MADDGADTWVVEPSHISCACNRSPHCADWGHNNLICYGACQAVVISKPKGPAEVLCTLSGHTGRVNSVAWIRHANNENETELLSCSADKTARVWRQTGVGKYETVAVLSGHSNTVTVGAAVYVSEAHTLRTLVATASVDSTLRIWQRSPDQESFDCHQTVTFGTGFMLHVAWVILPEHNVPLLSCGGDDQKVYIMAEQESKFVPVQKLQGHEDWVRAVDFTIDDDGDILMASCAQDFSIRIWRISPRDPDNVATKTAVGDLLPHEDIKMKENTFSFQIQNGAKACYAVMLESVMQGHENWVYSVHWHPPTFRDGSSHQPLCLLSTSMDKTMILWKPDPDSGVWTEELRVGAVGGNTLGLYGGVFGPEGNSVLAHGYQGTFHIWNKEEGTSWSPGVTVGGHFDSVQDIAWEPQEGQFLVSVGLDQTTRLHGYWVADDNTESSWHEVGRPQVHGYDMQCLAMINRYSFASGADEKVIRVFKAPRNFVSNLGQICQIDTAKDLADEASSLPEGASVPALGLSNKAVFEDSSNQSLYGDGELKPNANEQYKEAYFSPLSLKEPPTEENLVQNTLWPEVQKLYGHGHEIFTLACNSQGTLLASACKAAKADQAEVILWDASSWRPVCRLASHSLTVTQLAFSHDGTRLLSVSRDRTWTVFRRRLDSQPDTDPLYYREANTDKKTSRHSRIIWACSWSHDDKYFATASRDKKVFVWGQTNEGTSESHLGNYGACSVPLDLPDSVTTVDFAPLMVGNKQYLLACGLENGCICLYKWTDSVPNTKDCWNHCATLDQNLAHHLTVKRLHFCPRVGTPGNRADRSVLQLVSCGRDHTVKIFNVNLKQL